MTRQCLMVMLKDRVRPAQCLRRIGTATLAVLLFTASSASYADEQIDTIRQRGELVVGVKTDYPPFGMLTSNGQQQGFEHDLAADLAHRLGVRLRTVGVNTTNRLDVLNGGRADVTIATLGDTAERRKIGTLVEPDYYSSGVSLMTRPDSRVQHWSDLRGQTVCATQGSYFNRIMAERHLMQLQIYANVRDDKLAVRDKRCAGWLFDNTAIEGDLLTSEWRDYRIGLPPELVTPWAIAIARDKRGGALDRFVGDTVAQWHRDGTLIALERKWGLPPSPFLAQMHTLWSTRDASGAYVCRRLANGQWPIACRNPVFVTSTEVTGLRRWGSWLNEKTGLDLTYVYDNYERAVFLHGIALTLALTACCVSGSFAAALLLVWLAHRGGRMLSAATRGFSALARMTPPLLQIYVLFFGLGSIFAAHWGMQFSAFWIVVLVLCFYTGAGLMHTLDHSIAEAHAKDPGYVLDARSLPRLLVESSAAITASLVNVTKSTMMASAVAVPELLSASTSIVAEHGNVGTMMNTLMLFFLLLVFCVLHVLRWAQRRWCDVRS
jgi:polar amino acid transport system substrate-binding protein